MRLQTWIVIRGWYTMTCYISHEQKRKSQHIMREYGISARTRDLMLAYIFSFCLKIFRSVLYFLGSSTSDTSSFSCYFIDLAGNKFNGRAFCERTSEWASVRTYAHVAINKRPYCNIFEFNQVSNRERNTD